MHLVIDARTAADHFPGIGRYTVSLLHALSRLAPDLDISLLYDPSVSSSRLTLPVLPRISCPVSPFSIRQQWIIPGILHRAKANLYHSLYYLMPYFPDVPTVLTCHDLIPLVYPRYFSPAQRLIFRVAHTLALRTASVVIAISQSTKADLIRSLRVSPEKVVVIPDAAGTDFQPQSPGQIAAVRKKYTLPEQYVLYLGSNKPHKNLVTLVKAFAHSALRTPPSALKLVIAGHWDERYPEAKRLTEELGLKDQVLFIGPVADPDLPALYSGASLFVFPSLYEGFGLPVVEAMACSLPVICSNVSSLPEVAGEAALLVDPLDVQSLAAAMHTVMTDEALKEGMRGKGLVQAGKFSWERTAQETIKVYRRVSAGEK